MPAFRVAAGTYAKVHVGRGVVGGYVNAAGAVNNAGGSPFAVPHYGPLLYLASSILDPLPLAPDVTIPDVTAGPTVVDLDSLVHTRGQGAITVSPQVVLGSLVHTRGQGAITVASFTTVSLDSLVHTRGQGAITISPQVVLGSLVHTRAIGPITVGAPGAGFDMLRIWSRVLRRPRP